MTEASMNMKRPLRSASRSTSTVDPAGAAERPSLEEAEQGMGSPTYSLRQIFELARAHPIRIVTAGGPVNRR